MIIDDRLRLVFTCCHPALAREAQVALTLRLVCGLTTPEIAQAFLVPEPTMAARVTRAKKKISAARIPYRVPGPAELPDRLDAVLTVVHLLYTTGHTAPAGPDLVRADLVGAGDRPGPDAPRAHAGRAARCAGCSRCCCSPTRAGRRGPAPDGRLLLLEEQDRSTVGPGRDRGGHGAGHRGAARRRARPGRFALQAAIAAVHAEAPSYGETDWPQVLGLYDELMRAWPTPVVALNRAVAHAMVAGPAAGLADIEAIELGGRAGGLPLPARGQGRSAAPPRPGARTPPAPTRSRWT